MGIPRASDCNGKPAGAVTQWRRRGLGMESTVPHGDVVGGAKC